MASFYVQARVRLEGWLHLAKHPRRLLVISYLDKIDCDDVGNAPRIVEYLVPQLTVGTAGLRRAKQNAC